MNRDVPKIGGLLTLVGALALACVMTLIDGGPANGFSWDSSTFQILQNLATTASYLAVIAGILIFAAPQWKTVWAVIAIAAAVVCIFPAFGFIVPPVLIVVGGVLTIRYKPQSAPTPAPSASPPPSQ